MDITKLDKYSSMIYKLAKNEQGKIRKDSNEVEQSNLYQDSIDIKEYAKAEEKFLHSTNDILADIANYEAEKKNDIEKKIDNGFYLQDNILEKSIDRMLDLII